MKIQFSVAGVANWFLSRLGFGTRKGSENEQGNMSVFLD